MLCIITIVKTVPFWIWSLVISVTFKSKPSKLRESFVVQHDFAAILNIQPIIVNIRNFFQTKKLEAEWRVSNLQTAKFKAATL